jgi:hypothetical protein
MSYELGDMSYFFRYELGDMRYELFLRDISYEI